MSLSKQFIKQNTVLDQQRTIPQQILKVIEEKELEYKFQKSTENTQQTLNTQKSEINFNDFSQSYQYKKILKKAYEQILLRKGEISKEIILKKRKERSMKIMSKMAGSIIEGIENSKSKEASKAKLEEEKFRKNMQEQMVTFNKERYEKLQALGKVLTSGNIELSKSAQRRDCCFNKRLEISKSQRYRESFNQQSWNFKDNFQLIDQMQQEMSKENELILPQIQNEEDSSLQSSLDFNKQKLLFTNQSMRNYIENLFQKREVIQKRERDIKKTQDYFKIQIQNNIKNYSRAQSVIKEDFNFKTESSFKNKQRQISESLLKSPIKQQEEQYKKKMTELDTPKSSKRMDIQMAYDKEKLYALLTELKFEDIFCGDLVLLEHKLKAAANMQENEKSDQILESPGNKSQFSSQSTFKIQAKFSLIDQIDSYRDSSSPLMKKIKQKQTVQQRLQNNKELIMQQIVDCFDQQKGDDIDRQLFLQDIINFLEVNIDDVKRKKQKNQFQKEKIKQGESQKFQTRNFDLNEYKERLTNAQSYYSNYNLPQGCSYEKAIELKKFNQSTGIHKSDPPRSIYIPYKVIKNISGTSQSYHFNSKAQKRKRKNFDESSSSQSICSSQELEK